MILPPLPPLQRRPEAAASASSGSRDPTRSPIAAALFQPCAGGPGNRTAGPSFESHRLYYGHIVDPATGRTLDEVLLSVMKAPRSYTREDVVEINAHGGPVAVRSILEAVLRHGARLAEPGEFTRRAFLNGRIDLTQAEAVADLINARSKRSLESAAAQLEGGLRQEVQTIRTFCLDLLVRLEAEIDFPEDGGELIDIRETVDRTSRAGDHALEAVDPQPRAGPLHP